MKQCSEECQAVRPRKQRLKRNAGEASRLLNESTGIRRFKKQPHIYLLQPQKSGLEQDAMRAGDFVAMNEEESWESVRIISKCLEGETVS